MMKRKLPEFVTKELQPNVNVIWWGRRATFEVVEEVSEAIFRYWIIISAASLVRPLDLASLRADWRIWATALALCILVSRKAFMELVRWQNEIFVVVEDPVNGGGRIYKFWGWQTKRSVDEAITTSSPTILPEKPWFYRLWGWVTGEHMERITLKSVNHTYMDGRKISPRFQGSIKQVRGNKAGKGESPENLVSLRDIHFAEQVGGWIDHLLASELAKVALVKKIYGE